MQALTGIFVLIFSTAALAATVNHNGCKVWAGVEFQTAGDKEISDQIKAELNGSGVQFLDFGWFLVISPLDVGPKLNRLAKHVQNTYKQNLVFITIPEVQELLKEHVLKNDFVVEWPGMLMTQSKRRSLEDLQVILNFIRRAQN